MNTDAALPSESVLYVCLFFTDILRQMMICNFTSGGPFFHFFFKIDALCVFRDSRQKKMQRGVLIVFEGLDLLANLSSNFRIFVVWTLSSNDFRK